MKNLLILMALAVSVLLTSSCQKEEDPIPPDTMLVRVALTAPGDATIIFPSYKGEEGSLEVRRIHGDPEKDDTAVTYFSITKSARYFQVLNNNIEEPLSLHIRSSQGQQWTWIPKGIPSKYLDPVEYTAPTDYKPKTTR